MEDWHVTVAHLYLCQARELSDVDLSYLRNVYEVNVRS